MTVLVCDLVDATTLSGAIDPEQLGTLIRRYQDAAAGAIGRFGGFVAKFMGDGVLAYFGFPRAYEDAAERAVRAALAIVAEVRDIARPDGSALQTRIGIATGLVVVGEIVALAKRSIVGETPNLAARLQALAAPDAIMISAATQHHLGGLFNLKPPAPSTATRVRQASACAAAPYARASAVMNDVALATATLNPNAKALQLDIPKNRLGAAWHQLQRVYQALGDLAAHRLSFRPPLSGIGIPIP